MLARRLALRHAAAASATAGQVAGLLLRPRRCRPPRPHSAGPGGAAAAHSSATDADAGAAAPPPPPPLSLLPVVHHELFSAPVLPPGHRFPMQVFQRIHDRLLASGDVVAAQICRPPGDGASLTDDELALVHDPRYLAALSAGALDAARARRIGLGPITPLLMRRSRAEVAGTLLCARLALARGLAVSTAGGTHHAHADGGGGFCVLNDMAYAAAALVSSGEVGKVAIVDLDVHQGDGCAGILVGDSDEQEQVEEQEEERLGGGGAAAAERHRRRRGETRPPAWVRERVFTLSVHARNNFPARKRRSTLDVALDDGTGDSAYLSAVAAALERVLGWLGEPPPQTPPPQTPQTPQTPQMPPLAALSTGAAAGSPAAAAPYPPSAAAPALVIFDAGVDVHASDALGRLSLSDGGLRRRELLVLDTFLAAGVPVAGLVGGGYDADLDALAERHMHLHRAALRMWDEYGLGDAVFAGGGGKAKTTTATATAAAAF